MAVNWLSVYDKQSGVGLLLDDPDDHDVYCQARTRDGALHVHFTLQGPLREPVTAYHLVHGGDWHHVADVYRKRIGDRGPRPVIPAWAQDCDGWAAWIGNDINQGFSLVPYFWETRYAPNGLKLLDVYRAMYDGPWSYCGVYPYPCPWYGTPEELRETNLRLRDHGYRTIYYINYQLCMPDGPEVKRIGPAARSFLPEGIPPPFGGQYGLLLQGRSYTGPPSEQTPMDRGGREWSDRNLFWARWYVENLAVDGIYWDQLSCVGGGLEETAWNLQRLMDECRRLNPDFVTGGEGVGQAHGRSLTFGLASATFHRSELYRYTFPTQLVMDGTANGALAWGGGDKRFNAIFLNGCRFDNLPSDPTFRLNTLDLRRRTKQLLYQAEFRDTVGITLSLPAGIQPVEPGNPGAQIAAVGGIQAKRFQLNTDSRKLILVNAVNDPGAPGARATVRTAGLGPIQAAWAFLWDGTLKPLPFQQLSSAEVSVELPTSMQSTLALLNRCESLLYPEVPTMAAAGTAVPVKVTILNPNAKPISGRLRWEMPAGWSAEPAAFGPIASGKTAEVSSRLVVAAAATRRPYDLFCVAETPEGAGRRYASLSVAPSPYLEWTWEPQGVLKAIAVNLGERSVEATVEAVLPDGQASAEPRAQSVSLPPRGQKEAFFTVHGVEAMSEPIGMRLVVTSGDRRYEVPIRLFPFIPNGSFEVDRAGDGKPEYWTTYDFSGKIEQADLYPLISLDTDRPFDGKDCLRVDPFTNPARRRPRC